jgi:hypothetical protein
MIEWIKEKMFGKKNSTEQSITEKIPEQIPEKTFEEKITEKLDQIFNCNHTCYFHHLEPYEKFDPLVDRIIHKKFRYNKYKNYYSIEIYDATEPELREVVYLCELSDSYLMYDFSPRKFYNYALNYKYTSGIWDEEFLETLDELVSIKKIERKDKEERLRKETEQKKLNERIAELHKQERIRKMFTKEP